MTNREWLEKELQNELEFEQANIELKKENNLKMKEVYPYVSEDDKVVAIYCKACNKSIYFPISFYMSTLLENSGIAYQIVCQDCLVKLRGLKDDK